MSDAAALRPGRELRADTLPAALLDRATALLEPYVTEARRARLEAVLASRTREVVLVLEDLANEHNAAAVLRSAEAFGLLEIHVIGSLEIQRKITSGAHKWLDVRRHGDARAAYAHLVERGYKIWGADIAGDTVDVATIEPSKVALVFGNEHAGLSAEATRMAHGCFKVPMIGFVESLNVSVAAAISIYDLMTRRRLGGFAQGLTVEDARAVRAAWYVRTVRAGRPILKRAGLPVPIL